jgi:hypothetical protein
MFDKLCSVFQQPAASTFLRSFTCQKEFFHVANTIFAGWFFPPGKKYFFRDGFFHGKNRFFPLTGKKLPTLFV